MNSRVRAALLSLGAAALLVQVTLIAQATAAEFDGPARHVDRARLMRDVEALSAPTLEGRRTGTSGALKARQWLVDQFDDIGLVPGGTEGYIQPFTFRAREASEPVRGNRPIGASYTATNVIGRVPGHDTRAQTFVVTAHYDHLGIRDGVTYPGADDNASGVAVMLAAARHFVRTPPRHSIVFAALDAEEFGLRGARALIDSALLSLGEVAMNMNLDMVSRNDRNEIYAAGISYEPWLRPLLLDVQARTSVDIRFGHDQPTGSSGIEDWTHFSDHGPFHDAGIPFVYFGVEDHQDYHKATDSTGRIDVQFFGDVADMIIEALRTCDARID